MPRTSRPYIVKSMTYGKTFNNGEYESSRIELVVDLKEGEDPEDAFHALADELDALRALEIS